MIKVRQIKILVDDYSDKVLKKEISKKLKIHSSDILDFKVKKRSVDSRKKPILYFIFEVDVTINNESTILSNNINNNDIVKTTNEEYLFTSNGTKKLDNLYIVGAGPSGLMCAYTLVKNGYKVTIIDRGEPVETRVKDIESFWETGILKENSNVQFGEGGAGTFSDGKLNTLVKDKNYRGRYFFETLVKCGAPSEILFDSKPHIGTNLLREVIINLRKEIISMGGVFRYNTILTNITYEDNTLKSIELNNKEIINTNALVLAIGHSSRDTFKMLYDNKIKIESKPFAVGVRIMHNQEMINKSQIGVTKHDKLLEQSYKLTHTTKLNKGVYTFCMCPGGYVVNASSEQNMLVVNGMSNHERESGVANSAIIVTINKEDFGNHPLDGIEYQRKLEKDFYNICNGNVPIQLYKDFKNNVLVSKNSSFKPAIKGNYEFANIRELLPSIISDSIIEGIDTFDRKLKGFSKEDSIIAGIESRTSSPIKILRDEYFTSSVDGIYPAGEGSGYAGGITSAAIDGIKIAESIASKYSVSNQEILLFEN